MPFDADKVPSNLDQAVEMMLAAIPEEDRERLKSVDPVEFHHSSGRWFRNNWSLWDKETVLVQWFIRELKIGHADDISGTLMSAVWAKLRGEPFDAVEHVKKYHAHWAAYGVDPITGQKIK